MTKDPYTPMSRLICHAVERVTTEAECSLPLIPADAVQIKTVDIREAPRPSSEFILLLFFCNKYYLNSFSVDSCSLLKTS